MLKNMFLCQLPKLLLDRSLSTSLWNRKNKSSQPRSCPTKWLAWL